MKFVARVHAGDAWKLVRLFEINEEEFKKPVKVTQNQRGFEMTDNMSLFKVHIRKNYHNYFIQSENEVEAKELLGRVCGEGQWCFITIPVGGEIVRKRNFTVVRGNQYKQEDGNERS